MVRFRDLTLRTKLFGLVALSTAALGSLGFANIAVTVVSCLLAGAAGLVLARAAVGG